MKKEPTKTVSVSLTESLHAQLKILAKDSCRSLPGYIRQTLKEHLRELEQTEEKTK